MLCICVVHFGTGSADQRPGENRQIEIEHRKMAVAYVHKWELYSQPVISFNAIQICDWQ